MAVRRAHLVGSIPAADAADAMRLAVTHLGSDLDFLPDGETGDRRNWIIGAIESFRDHPVLELTRDGDWSDYDKTPRFRVRPGQRLSGAALDLGIVAATRQALPSYQATCARLGAAGRDLGFQVGIPGDVDLAMFTFGPVGPVRHLRPFTEALAATMRQIHELAGDDVLFQIEIPVELVLLARAPRPARAMLAALLARRVGALARAAPARTRFGVHLCLGDMNHRALGRLADAGPLVLLTNALVARWPAGRSLAYVHAPLAAADHPPVDDAAFYRPLRGLRLRGARFVAGYAHEDQDLDTQRRVRRHVEEALGRPADVSTSCGLGRRDRAAAVAAMDRIKTLLDD
ncbi:hypothetical protein WEI85_30050 [Actinomycetes bacterium KLBMP 9797]